MRGETQDGPRDAECDAESEGAFTLGNQYRAGVRLTPKVQFVCLYCAQAWRALSALAWLEEVGFSAVRMHMHEHRHGAPTSL